MRVAIYRGSTYIVQFILNLTKDSQRIPSRQLSPETVFQFPFVFIDYCKRRYFSAAIFLRIKP